MINNTNEFIIYALQVNIVWLIALLFYYVLLRKETFFALNRFYLISVTLLGIIIPFLGTYFQSLFENEAPIFTGTIMNAVEVQAFSTQISTPSFSFTSFLIVLFWIGFGIQLLKMIAGFYEIYTLKKRAKSIEDNIICSSKKHQPFSFLNQVYVSNEFEYSEKEREIIIQHEQKHIELGHTWDILGFEILKVIFWYSPFIYILQKQLKLIHEFQVDAMVVKNVDKLTYGRILVNQVYLNRQFKIANHFIFSQLKTRIDMMTKSKSSKKAILKYLLAIPLFIAFLFIFNLDNVIANTYDSLVNDESSTAMNLLKDTEDPIYKVVPEMPRFKGCENISDKTKRKECSNKAMLAYIYSNIKYPQEARDKGIQGMTVIQFVIEKDGSISNGKIIRQIEGGCGEEALRVVQTMPNWIPGKKDGKPVRVQFNLPIKFKLEKDTPSEDIYKKVDEMPRFPGCEDISSYDEKKKCSDIKMLNYIYSKIKYPEKAMKDGIQGMTVIRFIVEKDGQLSHFKTIRNIGGGCDEEAMKVMQSMPKWIPGKKDGKPVRVEFNLPIKFKMQNPTPPTPPTPPAPPSPK